MIHEWSSNIHYDDILQQNKKNVFELGEDKLKQLKLKQVDSQYGTRSKLF